MNEINRQFKQFLDTTFKKKMDLSLRVLNIPTPKQYTTNIAHTMKNCTLPAHQEIVIDMGGYTCRFSKLSHI